MVLKWSAQNTIEGWRSVFLIGGFAYMGPALLFMLFGSADVQRWNRSPLATTDGVAVHEERLGAEEERQSKVIKS